MEFVPVIILLFVVYVFFAIIGGTGKAMKREREMKGKFNKIDDFSPSKKVVSVYGHSGIAIDEGRRKVCLVKYGKSGVEADVLSYRDILSSEIFEEGKTVTKTSRSSQIAGALIGGLALGGVGAVIGGLSGKKTSSKEITEIELRLVVNRIENPIHDVRLIDMEQARQWHGLMEVIIRSADLEDQVKSGP